MPSIERLDHLVLTVADITATCEFYERVLGMSVERFQGTDGSHRVALKFGNQKINLHDADAPFEPKAGQATTGSADLCFLTCDTIETWLRHLAGERVNIEDGPIKRTGAQFPIMSVYIRDPDDNLIEVSARL